MKDFLILGLGFSGIAFSHELEKQNLSYLVVDPLKNTSCTFISGGLINPIIGRKYSLQWNIHELSKKVQHEYSLIEQKLGKKLLQEVEILKIHHSEAALEEWHQKKQNPQHQYYTDESFHADKLGRFIDHRYGHVLVKHALRIDTKELISSYAAYLLLQEKLICEVADYNDIHTNYNYFLWKGQEFRHVVCCDGIHAMKNPFFNWVHFKPAKGECMIIDIPNFQTDLVIQKKILLIQIGHNRFWVGATNDWDDLTDEPTEAGRMELEAGLQNLLKVPYNVMARFAAVRPTIRDRAPAVGEHPVIKNMFLLNGMGTKGAALSNYYAGMLLEHILYQKEINTEADVKRFFQS